MPLQSGIIINALIIFQILMAEKTKSNFVQVIINTFNVSVVRPVTFFLGGGDRQTNILLLLYKDTRDRGMNI